MEPEIQKLDVEFVNKIVRMEHADADRNHGWTKWRAD